MNCPVALLLCVYAVAALIPTASAAPPGGQPVSPCPKLFHYHSVNDPGRWTGNLLLDSDADLVGVWIRVLFDRQPKEVLVEGYDVVNLIDDANEVLIKNRDVLLKAGSPANVKITVKYDGDKFPNLIGYRLNARTVCPEYNTNRRDYFKGDDKAKDFLSSILSKAKPIAFKPTFECGLKRSDVYPWQAAVSINKDGNDQYICEATLISPSHVILPAHCVTFNSDIEKIPENIITVTLAGNNEKIGVNFVNVHRGYDPDILADDVAILELNSALKIDDNVRPICLDNTDGYVDTFVLTGKAVGSDGNIRDQVIETIVDEESTDDCAAKNPQLAGLLGENTLCVSYPPGKSPCVGNSGSSIISRGNNVASLKGFVIVGPLFQNKNQCNADTTAVAIDVHKYYKWILRFIS